VQWSIQHYRNYITDAQVNTTALNNKKNSYCRDKRIVPTNLVCQKLDFWATFCWWQWIWRS